MSESAPHHTPPPRHCIGHHMDIPRDAQVFIQRRTACASLDKPPHSWINPITTTYVRPPRPNDAVEPQQCCGSTAYGGTFAPTQYVIMTSNNPTRKQYYADPVTPTHRAGARHIYGHHRPVARPRRPHRKRLAPSLCGPAQ